MLTQFAVSPSIEIVAIHFAEAEEMSANAQT